MIIITIVFFVTVVFYFLSIGINNIKTMDQNDINIIKIIVPKEMLHYVRSQFIENDNNLKESDLYDHSDKNFGDLPWDVKNGKCKQNGSDTTLYPSVSDEEKLIFYDNY
jgi:hypothetical protein